MRASPAPHRILFRSVTLFHLADIHLLQIQWLAHSLQKQPGCTAPEVMPSLATRHSPLATFFKNVYPSARNYRVPKGARSGGLVP